MLQASANNSAATPPPARFGQVDPTQTSGPYTVVITLDAKEYCLGSGVHFVYDVKTFLEQEIGLTSSTDGSDQSEHTAAVADPDVAGMELVFNSEWIQGQTLLAMIDRERDLIQGGRQMTFEGSSMPSVHALPDADAENHRTYHQSVNRSATDQEEIGSLPGQGLVTLCLHNDLFLEAAVMGSRITKTRKRFSDDQGHGGGIDNGDEGAIAMYRITDFHFYGIDRICWYKKIQIGGTDDGQPAMETVRLVGVLNVKTPLQSPECQCNLIQFIGSMTKTTKLDYTDGVINDGDINDGVINDGDINDGVINDGDINDGVINDGVINDGVINDDVIKYTHHAKTSALFSALRVPGKMLFVESTALGVQNRMTVNLTSDIGVCKDGTIVCEWKYYNVLSVTDPNGSLKWAMPYGKWTGTNTIDGVLLKGPTSFDNTGTPGEHGHEPALEQPMLGQFGKSEQAHILSGCAKVYSTHSNSTSHERFIDIDCGVDPYRWLYPKGLQLYQEKKKDMVATLFHPCLKSLYTVPASEIKSSHHFEQFAIVFLIYFGMAVDGIVRDPQMVKPWKVTMKHFVNKKFTRSQLDMWRGSSSSTQGACEEAEPSSCSSIYTEFAHDVMLWKRICKLFGQNLKHAHTHPDHISLKRFDFESMPCARRQVLIDELRQTSVSNLVFVDERASEYNSIYRAMVITDSQRSYGSLLLCGSTDPYMLEPHMSAHICAFVKTNTTATEPCLFDDSSDNEAETPAHQLKRPRTD